MKKTFLFCLFAILLAPFFTHAEEAQFFCSNTLNFIGLQERSFDAPMGMSKQEYANSMRLAGREVTQRLFNKYRKISPNQG